MKTLSAIIFSFFLLLATVTLASPLSVQADEPTCDPNVPGVLINCTIQNTDAPLVAYIARVLAENTGYIIAFAVILVIWSGIEYIYSFGDTSKQAQAKTRIIEIVVGIIIYTLIFLLIRIISGDLNLRL